MNTTKMQMPSSPFMFHHSSSAPKGNVSHWILQEHPHRFCGPALANGNTSRPFNIHTSNNRHCTRALKTHASILITPHLNLCEDPEFKLMDKVTLHNWPLVSPRHWCKTRQTRWGIIAWEETQSRLEEGADTSSLLGR